MFQIVLGSFMIVDEFYGNSSPKNGKMKRNQSRLSFDQFDHEI